jgi:NAD(P)-dependent dehydrogenase (short-subunit alcohol dehydrogenase family)
MSKPSFGLDGRAAIVTGAASGIGQRLAQGLAEFGASVGCVDVAEEGLKATVAQIEGDGGSAIAVVADVSDAAQIGSAVDAVVSAFGPLRCAVNSAGIHSNAPADEMDRTTWQRLLDTNLTGVFQSCVAEQRAMAAHDLGGSIVNIGSISGKIANRGLAQAHYNAAKAGVSHLSRSLALEWADRRIRVNTLSPGYTATPMAKHPDVWEHVKHYVNDIPLGRMAETDELVGPAVFLLSDAASYCTAAELLVDGGACAW